MSRTSRSLPVTSFVFYVEVPSDLHLYTETQLPFTMNRPILNKNLQSCKNWF